MDHFSILSTVLVLIPWLSPAATSPSEASQGESQEAQTESPFREVHRAPNPLYGMVVGPKEETLYLHSFGELRAVSVASGEVEWTGKLKPRMGRQDPTEAKPTALALTQEWVLVGYSDMIPMAECFAIEGGAAQKDWVGAAGHKSEVTAVVADRKGKWIWLGLDRGVMSRITPTDLEAWSNRVMDNGGVTCAVIDPKDKKVAVGGQDGSVRLLDHSGASVDKKKFYEGDGSPIVALVWGPKGRNLYVATQKGALVRLSVSNMKPKWQVTTPDGGPQQLAVHPKGEWVAVGDDLGRVHLFDEKKGKVLATWKHPEAQAGVRGLAVVGKGKQILSAGGTTVQLWTIED